MAADLIPKVSFRIDDDCNLVWECAGCGVENVVIVLAPPGGEKTKQIALKESRKIETVQCDECCRKFDQR